MSTELRDRGELRSEAIRSVLELVRSQPETVSTWTTSALQKKGLDHLAAEQKLKKRANKAAPEVPHDGESMFSMLTWFVKTSAKASSNDNLADLFQQGLGILRADILRDHGLTHTQHQVCG